MLDAQISAANPDAARAAHAQGGVGPRRVRKREPGGTVSRVVNGDVTIKPWHPTRLPTTQPGSARPCPTST